MKKWRKPSNSNGLQPHATSRKYTQPTGFYVTHNPEVVGSSPSPATSRKPLKTLSFQGFFICSKNEGIPPYLNKLGDFWETNAKKAFSQLGFSLIFLQKIIIQKLAEKRQNILNNPPITTTSVLYRMCFYEIAIP